jgi:uncharacterized Zn finger protein (UPF0148 family)
MVNECNHAGNLTKLEGWETLWCPICDPNGTEIAHERENVSIPQPEPLKEKKNSLQLLLEKNKKEADKKKVPF